MLGQAIKKIEAYNRFGSKPGLERISELLRLLGEPQKGLRVIHVAGTNGKGSVCRYVYSALLACGYRAGLFTSPYLESFTERIELSGKPIEGKDLFPIAERVIGQAEKMVAQGKESPTEFEVVTAIALCYFKEQRADFVVLEVGLGGRADATNVIDEPLICAITSISRDHTEYLGDSLESIAREKAGIVKEGRPVVSAVRDAAAKAAIREICALRKAPFYDVSELGVQILSQSLSGSVFTFSGKKEQAAFGKEIAISMCGSHQIRNALCALRILELLSCRCGISLPQEACLKGLKEARQPARIEILGEKPWMVVDGAHNPESAGALCDTLLPWVRGKRVLVVAGILMDKDAGAIARELRRIGTDFILTEPDSPRKLPAKALGEVFGKVGVKGWIRQCPSCEEAVETSLALIREEEEKGKPYEAVVYTGSLYLVGHIRRMLGKK